MSCRVAFAPQKPRLRTHNGASGALQVQESLNELMACHGTNVSLSHSFSHSQSLQRGRFLPQRPPVTIRTREMTKATPPASESSTNCSNSRRLRTHDFPKGKLRTKSNAHR